ncbi:MAG: hypothetical protein ABWY78_09515 [Microvirga sp.]
MKESGPPGKHPDHAATRRKEIEAKLQGVTAQIAEAKDAAIKASLEKEAAEIRKELDAHD